jgi:predicted RNase H-like nuclease
VTVLGVDGCKGAWVAAAVEAGEVTWLHGRFADLLSDDLEAVAVDIPIGLAERGPRGCDQAAKSALGAAASRVFALPVRAAFAAGVDSHARANVLLRSLGEPGVSAQAWALRAAVQEVAAHAADPRLVEVHPELSFKAMTGQVLAPKKSARGVAERLRAFDGWVDALAALADAPARVPVDDCLDALAAAWSAQRVAAGTARAYPAAEPAMDRSGRPMVIYA